MLEKLLFWIYFANIIFLINHEIESAFWKEWKLFNMNKGDDEKSEQQGITNFVLIHFPLLFLIILGLLELKTWSYFGIIMSYIVAATGVFAFSIHSYFIKKGNHEFTLKISRFILVSTLILSIGQIIITTYIILQKGGIL